MKQAEDPDLWKDQGRAQSIMKEKTALSARISGHENIQQEFTDLQELAYMAKEENDEALFVDTYSSFKKLLQSVQQMQVETFFNEPEDELDCFFEIHAGAGGTESHDWALMLYRMYSRWIERHHFKFEIISMIDGEEAGIKSVCLKVKGAKAFGWLKNETGIHRLVRISPFNAQGKRQTSFASAYAFPVIEDDINIEIDDKDLRIDTFRSSGAGGQHVNTTDSAIRITHLPTGIVTQCQNDRSQHKNRAEAMKMLKARLYQHELQKREAEAESKNAVKTEIGWGHQIRSYVLHPYQMVKDHRTEHETSQTDAVLDGDLDMFMFEMMKKRAIERSANLN